MTPLHLRCSSRRRTLGMTLVETMVCLLIVGLLASLAAPAFRDMLVRQRIASVRTELTTAMQWARWEALRRNAPVALQQRRDCSEFLQTQNDWHCGWTVVVATAANGRRS